jgi:hypothetical protein
VSKQAMQKALDALEINRVMAQDADGNYTKEVTPKLITAAIADLRAALDAPVEPVAWTNASWLSNPHAGHFRADKTASFNVPMYTTPPDTEGLRRDAERYRWLTDDHPDRETREAVIRIGGSIWCRGKGSTDSSIDAAMEASK